jgi:hypothetical protein
MPVVLAAPALAIRREKRSIREVALEQRISLRGMRGSQTEWSEGSPASERHMWSSEESSNNEPSVSF